MSQIQVHKQAGVCRIVIDRPEKKNALTLEMYAAMAEAIKAAQSDGESRVLVIAGAGESFTAGNDLAVFAEAASSEHLAEIVSFMQALANCPLPVVAEVQGNAVGIGTTLLLHCDLAVAADNSRFVLPFVNLALVPEFASSYLLPRLVGHHKAAEWLMLGEPVDAQEALQFGLVNKVVALSELEATATKLAQKLAAKPRSALMHTKALLKPNQDVMQLHMNQELDVFLQQLCGPAAKEAFNAFLEKRQPDPKKLAL